MTEAHLHAGDRAHGSTRVVKSRNAKGGHRCRHIVRVLRGRVAGGRSVALAGTAKIEGEDAELGGNLRPGEDLVDGRAGARAGGGARRLWTTRSRPRRAIRCPAARRIYGR